MLGSQFTRTLPRNARLYGLEADLGMKGSQFQTAVSVLFVTYLVSLQQNHWFIGI